MKKKYIIKGAINNQIVFYKDCIFISDSQILKVLTKNISEAMVFNSLKEAKKIYSIINDPIYQISTI